MRLLIGLSLAAFTFGLLSFSEANHGRKAASSPMARDLALATQILDNSVNSGSLSVLSDQSVPRDPGNALIATAFGVFSGGLTMAVCTAIVPTGPVGVAGCIGLAALSIITTFFFTFKALGTRDLSIDILSDYSAIDGCSVACMLDTTAIEGEWRAIGNTTISGIFHEIHYQRNGKISGLRSYQSSGPSLDKRQAQDDVGGVVADYYWDNGNLAAYDSFGSSSSQEHRDAILLEDTLTETETLAACAGWVDDNGLLANGLFTVGWNNQPFEFSMGFELEDVLDGCEPEL